MRNLLLVAAVALSTTGCGIIYKQPIYQGNLIREDAVAKLQVGQSKQQVTALLGTPSIPDPFHAQRWDYTSSQRVSASAELSRPGGKLGLSAGTGRDTLPAWLSSSRGTGRVEQNDLAVFGQKNIGREGFVSIGGAVAKATLVPASDLPALADRWNSRSLSVGGGRRPPQIPGGSGPFSANIVGRVIDVPGQPGKFEGLGVGLTWRTPWSGQLTVGAENVITRGKNPFSLTNENADEGTVPYVRYEQDL